MVSALSRSSLCSFLNFIGLGDLIYLNAAGQPVIILNSHRVASDLLDRRAAIYSDRPPNIVASEIMCGGLLFPLARYGSL